jgi:hypothetical protein
MQLKLLQSFLNRKFAEFDYQIQQYTHNYRKQSYRITDTTNKNATIPPASPSFLHLVPMLITITLASCMLWVLTVCVRVCWGGAVLSCVYLKVFPPFFIQVVSVLEELNKYNRKKFKYMPEQI